MPGMHQHQPPDDPRDEPDSSWSRISGFIDDLLDRSPWDVGPEDSLTALNRQITAAAFIVVGLIGVLAWFSVADEKDLREVEFLEDIEVANRTDEIISVWARRDINPPLPPGFSITRSRPIECLPPECGIRSGKTEFWTISRESNNPEPPFAVTAWSSESGLVLFSAQITLAEMERAKWRVRVIDQR